MPAVDALARLPATQPERLFGELGLLPSDRWAVATSRRLSPTQASLQVDHVLEAGLQSHLRAIAVLRPGQWPDAIANFQVRWVGVMLDDNNDGEPKYPHLRLPSLGMVLQAWQRIVGDPTSRAYVEATWHPQRGEEEFALKWKPGTPRAEKISALLGEQLIADIEASQRRGKKPGDGAFYVDGHHFLEDMNAAIDALTGPRRSDPRHLTARQIRRKMADLGPAISSTTFYDNFKKATGDQRVHEYLANYAEFGGHMVSQQ